MLRKKMKKSVVVALTMGMVLSQGSVYLVATGPNIIPYETSKHKIHVGYINAEPVSILQMRLDYTEYDAKKTTTRKNQNKSRSLQRFHDKSPNINNRYNYLLLQW